MVENLREFYEKNGSDYDVFLKRLMGKEELIRKYLNLFLADGTFLELKEAVEIQDYDMILIKAHTLKGLSLNLNLVKIGNYAAQIVDDIRAGKTENINQTFSHLMIEYNQVCDDLKD